MRLNRLQVSLAILGLAACFATGCGGFQSSRSISPATFLLPQFFGKASSAPVQPPPIALEPATLPAATE